MFCHLSGVLDFFVQTIFFWDAISKRFLSIIVFFRAEAKKQCPSFSTGKISGDRVSFFFMFFSCLSEMSRFRQLPRFQLFYHISVYFCIGTDDDDDDDDVARM